jgi:hypothetical protein
MLERENAFYTATKPNIEKNTYTNGSLSQRKPCSEFMIHQKPLL